MYLEQVGRDPLLGLYQLVAMGLGVKENDLRRDPFVGIPQEVDETEDLGALGFQFGTF